MSGLGGGIGGREGGELSSLVELPSHQRGLAADVIDGRTHGRGARWRVLFLCGLSVALAGRVLSPSLSLVCHVVNDSLNASLLYAPPLPSARPYVIVSGASARPSSGWVCSRDDGSVC